MKAREKEMLVTLACKVRAFSVEQIEKTWWSTSRSGHRSALESLRRLESSGWLVIRRAVLRPIVELEEPIFEWHPEGAPPRFRTIARELHARSAGFATTTEVCVASAKSRVLFGARSATSQLTLTQMTHDLQVAEVFLAYRRKGFETSCQWVSEDNFPQYWPVAARPDALYLDDLGAVERAIEYCGDYSAQRLKAFHAALSKVGLAYELW